MSETQNGRGPRRTQRRSSREPTNEEIVRILRGLDARVEDLDALVKSYGHLPSRVDQALAIQGAVKKEIENVLSQSGDLLKRAERLSGDADAIKRDVETHKKLLRGDPDLGHTGIMERLNGLSQQITDLSSQVRSMQEATAKIGPLATEVQEMKQSERDRERLIRGIMIGLGVTGVTGIGTLITTILQVVGSGGTP